MKRRVRMSITLPPELVKKAKELGLNISRIAENALREYIRRLEGSNCEKGGNLGTVGSGWCGGWDLNPRRPTPEDLKSSPLS